MQSYLCNNACDYIKKIPLIFFLMPTEETSSLNLNMYTFVCAHSVNVKIFFVLSLILLLASSLVVIPLRWPAFMPSSGHEKVSLQSDVTNPSMSTGGRLGHPAY